MAEKGTLKQSISILIRETGKMSKMKKTLLAIITLLLALSLYSQEVEKLCEIEDVIYVRYPAGLGGFPQGMYYEEIKDILVTQDTYPGSIVEIELQTKEIKKENREIPHLKLIKSLKDDYWGISSSAIHPVINNKSTPIIRNSTGISFILKKDDGYIVYYVSNGGTPGAVDTTGKIYSNTEALAYLKEYDPEKYTESLARAEELGLKAEFERGNVLIWGKTYYSTSSSLKQYDSEGNKYSFTYLGDLGTFISCRKNTDEENLCKTIDANNYSTILPTAGSFSYSWYVGYGGNIYYYIAGEEYTEVFRIRRTWGNPDMYAMAINGYTEDNYGEYVKNTLSTMSKSDLRLLRNTIFALYGVHFKSEDLSAHFAKEVWYTDEGKTSGEVELPAHRQKLVEMIQELERK